MDAHNPDHIRDFVNHPVVADANPPVVFVPVSLRQPEGRGFVVNPRSATITRSCITTESRAKSFSAARSRKTLYTGFRFSLRQIFRKRAIPERLPPGAFQPRDIGRVFGALQKFLVIPDWQND